LGRTKSGATAMKRALFRIAAVVLCTLCVRTVLAEEGVTDKQILFGQVAALQGPAQDLGQGMRQGLLAAFAEVNREGAIAGRTLALKSLDDGYEPEKTVAATKHIIQDDKVFALVGAVGTPTSKAAMPIATAAHVPFIGPFTGAEFLRNPYNQYVVNVRASYFQETEAWIEHLTKDLGISRIAILYQDDAFGLAGLEGVQRAMTKRHMSLVASGTFTRNTTAVKSALLDISAGKPEAVVMVAPYKPVAAFIKLAHRIKLNAVFVAISFVGSDSLAKELGGEGAGVIVSQVVPSPWDVSLPLAASYQRAIDAVDSNAKPGFVSLEGYLVGRLVAEALRRTDGEPTRHNFLDAFVQKPFEIGGVVLHYGPANNQGSNRVYFTVLQADGSFKETTRLIRMVAQ
jgi:ABC-type branched-subunit amino acid transport system substrate-binding protein